MYGGNNRSSSYADLITMASQNAVAAHKKVAGLGNDRVRRADPKQVRLKEGVKKFLAKREEEDKIKKDEERRKKENLIQLRQQDRKATNRVRKMLSMTKSANKSCVEDAKDSLNASVAAQTQAGDIQPDEDDYGYTSNYADEMHKKMMAKYKSIPVKPAFPQERGVFVPRPQSLQKRDTGWRKNGNTNWEGEYEHSPDPEFHEEPVPAKKSKVVSKPPPIDYRKLLEMADQKLKEPAPAALSLPEKKVEREEFEFGRPMTAKEKAAYLSEKDLRERAARRHGQMSDKNNNSKNSNGAKGESDKPMPSFKIPRSKPKEEEAAIAPIKKAKIPEPETPRPSKESHRQKSSESNSPSGTGTRDSPSTSKLHSMLTKPNGAPRMSTAGPSSLFTSKAPEKLQKKRSAPASASPSRPPAPRIKESQKPSMPSPRPEVSERKTQERLEMLKEMKPRYLSAIEGKDRDGNRNQDRDRDRERERERDRNRVRNQPGKEVQRDRDQPKKQQLSPNDVARAKPSSRDAYSRVPESRESRPGSSKMSQSNAYEKRPLKRPEQRREVPMKQPPRMRDEPRRMPPKPSRGRAIIDSDEEYDSEMDDFIDDSEIDCGNISAEISRIFNYDRRRYVYNDEESDDECMESSVAQQMREENRTLRIGIQEDREEELREEAEKKRLMMKKAQGRR